MPRALRVWSGRLAMTTSAAGRRALVIGSIWPYHNGGARVPGLAKYLPECGWEPVVLTQPLPADADLPYRVETVGGDIAGTGLARGLGLEGEGGPRRKLARRLGVSSESGLLKWGFKVAREVLQYPDGHRSWRHAALERALSLVGGEHFDAVISTSPPVSTHLIAAELKRRFGLMWIADFPHLWSQDHGVPYGRVRRSFDRRLETRTLAGADALVVTNSEHARVFAAIHGAERVHVILHGFDPDTVNYLPVPLAETFTLTYTGGFSRGVREPKILLEAVAGLVDQGLVDRRRVDIRFYGRRQDWVQAQIDGLGLADVAQQCGQAPQWIAFQRQREAHVLLNFKCEPGVGEGILSSKVLEYVAAKRPVLSIGQGSDVADDILRETHGGIVVRDVAEVRSAVAEWYAEWSQSGSVAWLGSVGAMERFSQRGMGHQFASLLESDTSGVVHPAPPPEERVVR